MNRNKTKFEMIQDTIEDLATMLNKWLDQSRERSIALTKLEECIMWTNSAFFRQQERMKNEEQTESNVSDASNAVRH